VMIVSRYMKAMAGLGPYAPILPNPTVVGLYKLTPADPQLERRLVSTSEPINRETGFKPLPFTFNLHRYTVGLLDFLGITDPWMRWGCTSCTSWMQLTHSLKAPGFNP
jgi:hypothetical protein